MRLAFSLASSENPVCVEKNRWLKDFFKFKLSYYIGFMFYRDYIIVALAILL
ncbi:hypothetical protein CNEO3_10148 [Clostridium neonatale]|nr:hypothetical protein CNEO2_250082 [Clostridium neonatale]CAI3211935.1 hypothetical protein CNEO2_40125 [Clostridium neonatale]CAI3240670.1 hypothetical protein CNEO2_30125 [Clostridium neonatale]CAI3243363.1 hypothetical protein CNEO2_30125 [Clostridium neonatale]CAI3536720.1 hypothetical protein CNEO4_100125 [Clostridium neonatale]